MTECEHADAGKMLTEGVDPLRGIWKSWQDLRGSSAEHWYPDDMKAVAFVFNKVPSCYLPSEQCYCIAKHATCFVTFISSRAFIHMVEEIPRQGKLEVCHECLLHAPDLRVGRRVMNKRMNEYPAGRLPDLNMLISARGFPGRFS